MAGGDLGLEQVAQEVGVGPGRRGGLLSGLVELGLGYLEAELGQRCRGFVLVGDAHWATS